MFLPWPDIPGVFHPVIGWACQQDSAGFHLNFAPVLRAEWNFTVTLLHKDKGVCYVGHAHFLID